MFHNDVAEVSSILVPVRGLGSSLRELPRPPRPSGASRTQASIISHWSLCAGSEPLLARWSLRARLLAVTVRLETRTVHFHAQRELRARFCVILEFDVSE
jgi:hypothetical protein